MRLYATPQVSHLYQLETTISRQHPYPTLALESPYLNKLTHLE